ncbi:MAG TPA: VOC family protein [Gaiellaceae bacterium]|nr:VOC family protein [Gaiellaceae bacterium]
MTTITPYLLYADCDAALAFLSRAFGFEETLRYTGEGGYVNHAEMRHGDARIYMGDPGDEYRNPRERGGETVGVYVNVEGGVDELCERARTAGAVIVEEPVDQEYGERRFTARDPEGHVWYFAETIGDVAPADWGATTPS